MNQELLPMPLPAEIRPLAERAQRIRDLVGTARICIIEIGRELIAAKAEVKHGEWLPWLKREFLWTDETARKYMQVAEAFQIPTKLEFASLTIEASAFYVLAAPGVPQQARDEAIEAAKSEVITKAKAEELVREATETAVEKAIAKARADHEKDLQEKIDEATDALKDDKKALKKELATIKKQYQGEPGIPVYLAVTARALGVKNLSPAQLQLVAQLLGHGIVINDKVTYHPVSKEQERKDDEMMRICGDVYRAFEVLTAAPDSKALLKVCFPIQRLNIRKRLASVRAWLDQCEEALKDFDPNEKV